MNSHLLTMIAALAVALPAPARGPCCCVQQAEEAAACCADDSAASCCQEACCVDSCCQSGGCCSGSDEPAPTSNSGPCGCEGCPADAPADPGSPASPVEAPERVDSADSTVLCPAPMAEDTRLLAASDPMRLAPLTRPAPEQRALICVWTL